MNLEQEFPLRDDLVYLNHAAVAPWPTRTAAAVQAFAEQNRHEGATHYPRWMETEQQLRDGLRDFINADSSDEIALLKNTSEGLSVIAWGLDWQPGDNIVSYREEFPSNRIVWESLAPTGVELRLASCDDNQDPEAALQSLVDKNTRLVSVSSVQYASGLRIDLERLGNFCHANDLLFCVDAIQSLGALPLDVQACHADFVVADAHKWLLGPEGIALFYCRQSRLESLRLHQYGWHMVEDYLDFDRRDWQPAASARRFECGSPNMLGIHAFNASLSLLIEAGADSISARVLDNTSWLATALGAIEGVTVATPTESGRFAGIVSFTPRSGDVRAVFEYLGHHGVVCALRDGRLRFSPHFYTPRARLERAVALVADCNH